MFELCYNNKEVKFLRPTKMWIRLTAVLNKTQHAIGPHAFS
jgi:hypothetical protein